MSWNEQPPLLPFIGRWLCNLGYHQPRKHGSLIGRTETYTYTHGSTTIPFITCQRCGREYIGTVTVQDSYRFPLDRPAGPNW